MNRSSRRVEMNTLMSKERKRTTHEEYNDKVNSLRKPKLQGVGGA